MINIDKDKDMKNLKKLFVATILTLALSGAALAGDISGGRTVSNVNGDISGGFTVYVLSVITAMGF